MALTKEQKQLLTPEGFDRRFYRILNTTELTQREAWEQTESEYFELFGQNRYSSFDSYRVAKNKRIKN